jgi:hypothetical protein
VFISTSTASAVTDDAVALTRTFSWTTAAFVPPRSLGTGAALNLMAIGTNAAGDALVTPNNANITLTP